MNEKQEPTKIKEQLQKQEQQLTKSINFLTQQLSKVQTELLLCNSMDNQRKEILARGL